MAKTTDHFASICVNVIYCITCTLCKEIYLGETGGRLAGRFRKHLRVNCRKTTQMRQNQLCAISIFLIIPTFGPQKSRTKIHLFIFCCLVFHDPLNLKHAVFSGPPIIIVITIDNFSPQRRQSFVGHRPSYDIPMFAMAALGVSI